MALIQVNEQEKSREEKTSVANILKLIKGDNKQSLLLTFIAYSVTHLLIRCYKNHWERSTLPRVSRINCLCDKTVSFHKNSVMSDTE